ncbi:cell division protein [Flavobacterium cheongpyeongense]|jgi:transitional endoplasmic reticulum ATPase|uniref:Cell division protein n=1 Tax=Flavobacterium cheongpyeongense TaxID=2212651 RepID=A0A2V4BKN2_9FLAO|nr:ATP-binding protein [Flavobacterium cheongpyeongense]PXY39558.1 cell division protein [Flavobacterium cheongpyeongense]
MSDNTIDSLKEALKHSPENTPLRLLLAETLLSFNRLEEAETEFLTVLRSTNDIKAKVGLATTFFKKGNYSACNVILEEVIENGTQDLNVFTLYAKGLLKENSIAKAVETYKRALAIDPKHFDEELDSQLRLKGSHEVIESDDEIDSRFLEKPTVNFADVGGMESVKKEIELKIIKPLQHPELYKAYGKKTGGGILLYGPPGCGKTYIAKATAGQVNAKFISVGLNDILDMWIGSSEKNLHDIFELARQNTPCVLFIDEIDALGASRSDMKQSSGRHLINQFLQELDGIDNNNEGILVLGATNTPWNLDPAFRRPGRFDRIVFVPPPDETSRESILRLKLNNKPTEAIDYNSISKKIENFSGADIEAIIDIAIEEKLESSFEDGIPKPISTKDLQNAIKKHKASTQEWFMTAKNFAMFANDSGLYDDILTYLKIKK